MRSTISMCKYYSALYSCAIVTTLPYENVLHVCNTLLHYLLILLHYIFFTYFAYILDLASCLLQDRFLPFVDMFQKETIKVDVCKLIMEAFAK